MELRPNKLCHFIGKEKIKNNISIFIESAKKNNTCIDHILLIGAAGTGKTTLALIIANEIGSKIKIAQGNMIQRNIDVINLALSLNNGDILFIDEIHAINKSCIELLYSIMEDFVIDIAIGKDFNTKMTRLNVPKFTLIGATTDFGDMKDSLLERFGIHIVLDGYSDDEILELIKTNCQKLNLNLTASEINTLKKYTNSIPRTINQLIKRIHDFRNVNPKISIAEILERLNVYKHGINENEMKYLKLLNKYDIAMGIKTLSDMLNINIISISNKIEPHLLRIGFISKKSNGRVITKEGKKFLNDVS